MCKSLACYLLDRGVVSLKSVRPVAVDSLHIRDISFLLPFSCVFFFLLPSFTLVPNNLYFMVVSSWNHSVECLPWGTCSVNSLDLEFPTRCQAQVSWQRPLSREGNLFWVIDPSAHGSTAISAPTSCLRAGDGTAILNLVEVTDPLARGAHFF